MSERDPSLPGDEQERSLYQWYVLALLVLTYTLSSADKTIVSVVAEPLKREMGLTDSQLGFLSGTAFSLAYGLLVLPMGYLLDRVDRRRLLAAMLTLWSGLTAISAVCKGYPSLLVARFGVGGAETAAVPGGLSILADVFPPSRRSTAVSIFYAGAAMGTLVGYTGGGWVLANYGWRAVYVVIGLPGILLAPLLAFTIREPARGGTDGRPARAGEPTRRLSLAAAVRAVAGNRPLVFAIIGNAFTTGVLLSVTLWSTSFLVRVFELSPASAASHTGVIFGVGTIVASCVAGPLTDLIARGDERRLSLVPAGAAILGALGTVLLATSPTLWFSYAGMWILSIAAGFFLGNGFAIVVGLAHPSRRGSTLAVTKLVTILGGTGIIPLLTGAISDFVGGTQSLRPAIGITGLLLVVAALFFYLSGAASRREEIA